MRQGRVDAQLAAGTLEPVRQRFRRLGRRSGQLRSLLLLLGLLPPLRGAAAACPAGLPRPDAGADLLGVVEALGTAGRAADAVEAGVVDVALERVVAGVLAVLPRAVGVA